MSSVDASVYDSAVQGTGPPDQEPSTGSSGHIHPYVPLQFFFGRNMFSTGPLILLYIETFLSHTGSIQIHECVRTICSQWIFEKLPVGCFFFSMLCIMLIKLYHTPQDFFANLLRKPTEMLTEWATDEWENSINQHCFLFLLELQLKDKGFISNNNSNNKKNYNISE